MRKLIAMVAVVTGLMLGSVANAAQVDIFLTQTSASEWSLTINNNGPQAVTALNLFVSGLDVVVFNNPNISTTFSAWAPGAAGAFGFLIADATGSPGPLTAPNTLGSLIATLSGANADPVAMEGAEGIGGSPTVFFGTEGSADYSITVTPIPPVPEPTTMVLFGLGLAALGLVRRSA